MKARQIRELTEEELRQRLDDIRRELFNLRVQKSTAQVENPLRIRALRREIARMSTVAGQRAAEAK
jgi:large subunit ribosomal protein L29